MNEATRKTLMSSATDDWRTPPELFSYLNSLQTPFDLDAAASHDNHLCDRYFTAEDDALAQAWDADAVWCNPPHSRSRQKLFIAKAYEEVWSNPRCRSVTMLIPARTDTRAWFSYVMQATAVVLLRGRVSFLDATGQRQAPAPFPSAVVYFQRTTDSTTFISFPTPRPAKG